MEVASKVEESVDQGRLENCSTKRDIIKSLSQGQFDAGKKKKKKEVGSGTKPSPCDEMYLGSQFPV